MSGWVYSDAFPKIVDDPDVCDSIRYGSLLRNRCPGEFSGSVVYFRKIAGRTRAFDRLVLSLALLFHCRAGGSFFPRKCCRCDRIGVNWAIG